MCGNAGVTDAKRCDADEPVDEAQKSWLRSLVGVLGCLESDRLDTVPCQEFQTFPRDEAATVSRRIH